LYKFNLIPKTVEKILTSHRKIVTSIPPQQTIDVLKQLSSSEPVSMQNELPVLWDHAVGYNVFDSSGNCWIDFSSGIFVANVGHGHPHIQSTILNYLRKPLLHNYYFPSEIRLKLVTKIKKVLPNSLDTVFLLTTGTEATECALKITRIHGQRIDQKRLGIISFDGAMHGKTLGSLMLGGKTKEKYWIGFHDPNIHHIPFPYSFTCPWGDNSKDHLCDESCFNKSINELKKTVDIKTIAGIIIESYQGWGAIFYPKKYIDAVVEWVKDKNILLIFDEIQSGFGRTGKFFAFEYYDVIPDIVCCGKGISSSLPLSAVIANHKIIDVDPSLNSTHGGNPICCAAALASLEVIEKENLIEESARKGKIIENELNKIRENFSDIVLDIQGKGMIFAIHLVHPNTLKLDVEIVDKIIERCMEKGLLMIRTGMGTIKIGPPLIIPDDALLEGLNVLSDSIREIHGELLS
jgi:4-aminobutyrate aminotransferase-like enzyme